MRMRVIPMVCVPCVRQIPSLIHNGAVVPVTSECHAMQSTEHETHSKTKQFRGSHRMHISIINTLMKGQFQADRSGFSQWKFNFHKYDDDSVWVNCVSSLSSSPRTRALCDIIGTPGDIYAAAKIGRACWKIAEETQINVSVYFISAVSCPRVNRSSSSSFFSSPFGWFCCLCFSTHPCGASLVLILFQFEH